MVNAHGNGSLSCHGNSEDSFTVNVDAATILPLHL